MESIGARFHQTREAKGYTLEQVARDTHIAKRFIEALEGEDFAIFPGEPYLLGFMRTYSNYLGLDPEETVALYQNLKLQEQPPPIDELISKGPAVPVGRIALIVVIVLALAGAGYYAVTSGIFTREARPEAVVQDDPVPSAPQGELIQMVDEIVEQRFSQGDRIMVPVQDESFAVDLAGVGDDVLVRTAGGERRIPVGGEAVLDLNADQNADLRVVVRGVDTLDNPPTVVMRLDRGSVAASGTTVVQESVGDAIDVPAVGSTLEPSREETARLIAAFDEREEFLVEVRFEGYSLFRYEADDEPRVEQYFQAGDTIRTSVQREFQLWASNAASVRLRVAGQDLALGDPGEVTAGLVTWVPDTQSDRVLLQLIPVY
ncbi:MAG: helix-turn-helix domain-containing protein [Spirochaetota bacterium]